MKRILPLILAFLLTLPAAAFADSEPVYHDLISDIAYIDDGNTNHLLDIYGSDKSEPAKTVIEVHGGGFIGGSKTTNTNHSIVFADAGYVVVTPEYSKVPRGVSFPDVIQELFAVYNWVGEHAGEYNIDLNNIFLSGDSAGGYYVTLSMAVMHDPALAEYFGVTVPSYFFSGYVTTCPSVDVMRMREDLGEGKTGPASYKANTIGAEILMNDDLMSHMDLFTCTDPNVFDGLYMMTTPDDTVSGEAVLKFDQYLTEQGIDHILNSYEGTENKLMHVFNVQNVDWPESISANQDEISFMESLLK